MAGEWKLVSPDGRVWKAPSPLQCVSLAQRERVPSAVVLARVLEVLGESDLADRHVGLGIFYGASRVDELIDALWQRIASLEKSLEKSRNA